MHSRNLPAGLVLATLLCCMGATPQAAPTPGVRVEIDGQEHLLGHVEESGSSYSRLASTLSARQAAGSTEQIVITLLQVDLKQLTYPIDLPGPRDFSNPTDLTGPMASIGLSYIDAEGQEWAGPGKIHIESFDRDGTLRGTFDDVTLPHVDDALPDITLENGTFEVRITAPW